MADSNEVDRIIAEELTSEFCEGYVAVGEDSTMLPELYLKYEESLTNFVIRDDDVIVASYPRAGSTWMQHMVWLIVNDLDFEGAEINLRLRVSFLECCINKDWQKFEQVSKTEIPPFIKDSITYAEQQDSPRIFKTHLPFFLLPRDIRNGAKFPKIIYLVRDPKDVCVSYYHMGKLLRQWQTTLSNFVKVFLADKAMYGPFWKHILGYWRQRKNLNMLIIKYKDMVNDLPCTIERVAKFLNKKLNEQQIQKLTEHLGFRNMRNNSAVNGAMLIERHKKCNLIKEEGSFIRAGVVGKHKEELSSSMIDLFEKWTKDNLSNTDFNMQLDLQ